ncbi:hypothetical protein C8R46DRAFT_1029318 [Mycena filopes]|nr:hypothetical protein C8R46DRAFT_1029318 [Mycena filopes]
MAYLSTQDASRRRLATPTRSRQSGHDGTKEIELEMNEPAYFLQVSKNGLPQYSGRIETTTGDSDALASVGARWGGSEKTRASIEPRESRWKWYSGRVETTTGGSAASASVGARWGEPGQTRASIEPRESRWKWDASRRRLEAPQPPRQPGHDGTKGIEPGMGEI